MARLRTLIQEADEDAREYLTDTIYGHVNNYYLDVARPGSDSNKVNILKLTFFVLFFHLHKTKYTRNI